LIRSPHPENPVSQRSESRQRTVFDAEIVSSQSGVTQRGWLSASEIDFHAREVGNAGRIMAAEHANGVSHGEFYAWLSGDRALVRVDEHREWYAHELVRPGGDPVEFYDEDGESFTQSREATISRPQALAALTHWLSTGRMLPALTWE
jgi:hypothetical protein